MDRAAAVAEEVAVCVARDAEASAILGAEDVLFLEVARGEVEVGSDAENVGVAEVDEALLLTARRAPGLAFEAETFGHQTIMRDLSPSR